MRVGRRASGGALAVVLLVTSCSSRPRGTVRELADADPAIRSEAALRLGREKSNEGVDALLGALNDPEESVRVNVLTALGDIGDKRVVPRIAPLIDDRLSTVRMACAQALGKLGDPRGVPALEKALYDTNEPNRMVAARALGAMPGPEAEEVLLRVALQDEDERVRSHVVQVIGERHLTDAVPRLESALRAESERVRANAAAALGTVGDASSLPALSQALEDPYFKVRCLAAHSIAKVAPHDPGARDALVRRLAVEKDGMARVDMAWALGSMGDPSQLDVVRTMLFQGDPEDVRAEAAIALGTLGRPADLPVLEKALNDKKGLVRSRAAEAIEKIKGAQSS